MYYTAALLIKLRNMSRVMFTLLVHVQKMMSGKKMAHFDYFQHAGRHPVEYMKL